MKVGTWKVNDKADGSGDVGKWDRVENEVTVVHGNDKESGRGDVKIDGKRGKWMFESDHW